MCALWAAVVLHSFCVAFGVAFGAADKWATKPRAKIQVVAKGHISPEFVRLHVIELKKTAAVLLKSRGTAPHAVDEMISVDIKRTLLSDDDRPCIDTLLTMT